MDDAQAEVPEDLGAALRERHLVEAWREYTFASQNEFLDWLDQALPEWRAARVWEVVNTVQAGCAPPTGLRRKIESWSEFRRTRGPLIPPPGL